MIGRITTLIALAFLWSFPETCESFTLLGHHRSPETLNYSSQNRAGFLLEIDRCNHKRHHSNHRTHINSHPNGDLDENLEKSSSEWKPPSLFSISMLILPFASFIFPNLLQLARSLPPNSSEQLATVTALFVSNRVHIYAMAATIVGLTASRGSQDALQLGRRITDLTEELLYRPTLEKFPSNLEVTTGGHNDTATPERSSFIQSFSDSGLEETLDQVSSETQAVVLPLLVSFFLALSVFLLPFWSSAPSVVSSSDIASGVREILSTALPLVSQVWNFGILALFTRSEIRRLGYELKWPDSALLEWVMALSVVLPAFLLNLWPAQNFVNMALAILVGRAIQLDSLAAIVGALLLLAAYDATSVFLIPASGAAETMLQGLQGPALESDSSTILAAVPSAADSAMGSVAIQKLTSGTFQPGLLVTKIGNSLGGSLGLGDAVFPSLLATFAKRFDDFKATAGENSSLFLASMVGYALGCGACEFIPMISSSGLPALVFIVPLMLVSVFLAAALSGQTRHLLEFDP